jgi:hypothetical protein
MADRKYFEERIQEWLPGAMFPSEVWWLYKNILRAKPDILIECGRQDGYSTRLLAYLLAEHEIPIYSIDFDADKAHLAKVKATLDEYKVECVSGDIHVKVPELLETHRGKKIAIVQDGPKGWEGLSTLMAAVLGHDVVLCAQHNLHIGHISRKYFQLISNGPTFLEFSDHEDIQALRELEQTSLQGKNSNRELDHSSLGVFEISDGIRPLVRENIASLEEFLGVWSAVKTLSGWQGGNYNHVSNIRKIQKFSLYRFKKR